MEKAGIPHQHHLWREHWQDEGDAAFLYRHIAAAEQDPTRVKIFTDLAHVEDQHVARWTQVLHGSGVSLPPLRPSLRARIMLLVGRLFGWRLLTSLLLAEEGRETKGYLSAATNYDNADAMRTAAELAKESAEHAIQLGELLGTTGEPWHRTKSGGFLRNAVYGFNDGLTANFGLVMGVLGANVPHHIVVVSGVAGLFADALSMGSSGFLAAKSEREVYTHEIAVEKEELRVMPDLEEAELALLYQTRGMHPDAARRAAHQVMENPDQALQEQAQLELGIGTASMSPLREGWITGIATAVGALIPVFPFLILHGPSAVWVAFTISMLSHFGVGGARSIFTGRGVFRSGLDMFVVGLGIAIIGYFVGGWIASKL
jgi:vacuolar iron transporter family protein